jgi:DNA repair protein RecN (Recombination protein N)
LVLGKRADLTSLKQRAKCIIEAHFEIAKYNLAPFLKLMIWIMKRRPSLDVKFFLRENRELINSPVNLPELQELGLF